MKVVIARPPNYEQIIVAFPQAARRPGVIFAYGDAIYNPGGVVVAPSLIVHEDVHSRRQGSDPLGWWKRYIADMQFRLNEEVLAHRAEWRHYETSGAGRNARRQYLSQVANRLASPLYGSMITAAQAKEIISA